MIIYGASLSPYVRKVLAFASEKGIGIELVPAGRRHKSPEFLAASPFAKIPALKDGDFTLADSSAIVHYMDAKRPEPNLVPAEPQARGRAIWFDEFADTILFGAGRKLFFNRLVAPHFLGQPGDPAEAAAGEAELPPIFDYLEREIPEGGFLVEERLTLADIAVASPFANLLHLGITVDAKIYPRLAAFVERMLARPSFQPWIDQERDFLAKLAA